MDARMSLALWLRAGRVHRGMSLDDVAKITKIQPRILERLEAGKLDGLPAEVFVRGFVRSVARCVGLDEEETLRRYAACGLAETERSPVLRARPEAPDQRSEGSAEFDIRGDRMKYGRLGAAGSPGLAPTVRAVVEAMVDLAPGHAAAPRATPRKMHAVEVVDLATGSLRDLPAAGTLVETMLLPETGTIVPAGKPVSAPPTVALAEAMSDADLIADPHAVPAVPEPAEAAEARAMAPSMVAAPAAVTASPVEPAWVDGGAAGSAELTESSYSSKKKRGRRGKGRNKRASGSAALGLPRELRAVGTPAGASPIVVTPAAADPEGPAPGASSAGGAPEARVPDEAATPAVLATPTVPVVDGAPGEIPATDEPVALSAPWATWAPKMPPISTTPSVPWRKPAYVSAAPAAVVVPSLVIDDADPESAERILEERAETHAPRRSFLPPILLDREDRSERQGGLTLAVILLLIAATLTLSYLMRRPSAGGDGMTRLDMPAGQVDSLA